MNKREPYRRVSMVWYPWYRWVQGVQSTVWVRELLEENATVFLPKWVAEFTKTWKDGQVGGPQVLVVRILMI